jgi:hypothetical protein
VTTAILVPSLDRPQRLRGLVENVHCVTREPHRFLFEVSDDESKSILDEMGEQYIDDALSDDRRYVTRMNEMIQYIDADVDTIFFGSDDVVHHPHWLTYSLEAMRQSGRSVAVMNDLHNSAGTQALIRREYLELAVFDEPGLAFHPGYQHNFADTEMFYTAGQRFQYVWVENAIVEHLHPVFGGVNALPWDPTYVNAKVGWDADAALWTSRKALIDRALG